MPIRDLVPRWLRADTETSQDVSEESQPITTQPMYRTASDVSEFEELARERAMARAQERASRMVEEQMRASTRLEGFYVDELYFDDPATDPIDNRVRGVEKPKEKLVDHGCNPMCAKCLPNVRKLLRF